MPNAPDNHGAVTPEIAKTFGQGERLQFGQAQIAIEELLGSMD